jgi:hypothetical protein
MRVQTLMKALALAAVVLVGAIGSATAADEWFVMGEKTLKATDPSAEVTAEGDKWLKEDIKKAKISIEGADVEISKVVLHWNNARDDTIENIGVVKWGGFTAEKDAPGHEATLMSVAVQYKILNNAPSATIKVWGFD